MTAYLRYGWVLLFSAPLMVVSILAGGAWTWLGFFGPMAVMLTGDILLLPDKAISALKKPWLLNIFLLANLPLNVLALILLGWKTVPGDFAGIGALVQNLTGVDILVRRELVPSCSIAGTLFSISLLLSTNFFIAHELIHRRNQIFVSAGRWLLAVVCDTQFSLSHLYQHHKHVCTSVDPASARRGESLYRFALRSSLGQIKGAWLIEKTRLNDAGSSAWSFRNRFLTGQCMTLVILVAYTAAFGRNALLAFLFCAIYAKFLYEAVNYIQHYGLVRVPGTLIEPRHSWDCAARMSSSFFVNLTRHADHHARGDVPFWNLCTEPKAPTHSLGYMATISIAMIPPLWARRMKPLLQYWDTHLASRAEVALTRSSDGYSHASSPNPT
jgi:alkane 1-monooxygenase